MKTTLWSARWSTAKGWYWKQERECIGYGEPWLDVFQENEPDILFWLSSSKPPAKILRHLERPLISV